MSSLCKTRLNMDVIILQKRKKESFQMIIINHELENCIYNVLLLYCCHYFFILVLFLTSFEIELMFSIIQTKETQIYLYILRHRAWSSATAHIRCRSIIMFIIYRSITRADDQAHIWHLSPANEAELAPIPLLEEKKSQQKNENVKEVLKVWHWQISTLY